MAPPQSSCRGVAVDVGAVIGDDIHPGAIGDDAGVHGNGPVPGGGAGGGGASVALAAVGSGLYGELLGVGEDLAGGGGEGVAGGGGLCSRCGGGRLRLGFPDRLAAAFCLEVAALRSGSEASTAGAYARPAPSCSLLERSMPRATTAFTGA